MVNITTRTSHYESFTMSGTGYILNGPGPGLWGVAPVLILELFGATSFGACYTTFAVAPAFSSFVLATWLAGGVYDHQAGLAAGRVCH